MDITEVNDFLLQQATGRTKAEVQQDIEDIKRLTQDLTDLKSAVTAIAEQLENTIGQNTVLRTENTELQNHNRALKTDNERLDQENRHMAVTLPLLKAECDAYNEQLKDFNKKYGVLENRIKEAERIENANRVKENEITISIQQEEELKRYNIIQTKKVTDLMESNSYQIMQINLQQKPIHVHIRNIQAMFDKKGIKFDIIKELNVL